MNEEILQKLEEAQLILIGLGKEWETSFAEMNQDPFYITLMEQAAGEKDGDIIKQYLRLHYIRNHQDEKKKTAYEKLSEILNGKNYFIVSLNTDDYIFQSGLDQGRFVTPCGGYRALQCMESDEQGSPLCVTDQELLVSDQEVIEQVMKEISECKGDLALVDFPVCNECGRILGFNQISTPGYREDGYLPMWNKYMKWLQGTINRNVCILELGAGMEYPSVIRFPFEKLAFFNQKAVFYRVHSWLYQMTEELKEKGSSVNQNPIDFVLNEGIKE